MAAFGTHLVLQWSPRDVPQTNGSIIRATDEMALHEGAPGEAIALSLVPREAEVRIALIILWLGRMFAVVKDVHLCTDGLCGNHEGVLRHVARSVDLALVIDLLDDRNLACFNAQGLWEEVQ